MVAVERARAEAKVPRAFKLHELQAILASCPPEHLPFFLVLALTGLRRSEIFRLRWDWCDFDSSLLLIKQAKRGSNQMPMSPRVQDALHGLGPRREGLVFPGRRTRETERQLTSKRVALASVLRRAGVDPTGVGLHTFRHTFIGLLERTPGVSYSVVKALARHSMGSGSRDITSRYLHPDEDELRWALGQLETRVFGPTNVVQFPVQAVGK